MPRLLKLLRQVLRPAQAARGPEEWERDIRVLHKRGDPQGALAAWRQAVASFPEHAELLQLGAVLHGQAQQFSEALRLVDRAMAAGGRTAMRLVVRGNILLGMGDHKAAWIAYKKAALLAPDLPEAHYSLALAARHLGKTETLIGHGLRALALRPGHVASARVLVDAWAGQGLLEEAQRLLDAMLRQYPGHAVLHDCQGYVFQKLDQPAAAARWYRSALEQDATLWKTWDNLGTALQELGEFEAAWDCYERACTTGEYPAARWHQSLLLLLQGRFQEAWPLYEYRLQDAEWPSRALPGWRWRGSPANPRGLVVINEQGLGDEIMFASCVPDLVRAVPNPVLLCDPRLLGLFQRSFPAVRVLAAASGQVPHFTDGSQAGCHIPAGSLPGLYRNRNSDFPRHQGYLRADPERIARWRKRLEVLGTGAKIGISWRGGSFKSRQRLRSTVPEDWQPLMAAAPGAHFISLQYDLQVGELQRFALPVHHWSEAISDYDETAALVCALDLVISVQTAVVHLGGALGRPVWVLLPAIPEWRYGMAGETMPWYPAVTLLRQQAAGQWQPLFVAVASRLRQWLELPGRLPGCPAA